MTVPDLASDDWLRLLLKGEITVLGQMPWSSNATFLVELCVGELVGRAIYKPGRGERPLWDFPGGLFRREASAYVLSTITELHVIPETVIREDAPLGRGSIQRFIDADFAQQYFTFLESEQYADALREIAGFDLLANNADRKGGHILVDANGRLWGIDNGLCFHVDDKLRTVMWDFAGESLPPTVVRACELVAHGDASMFRDLLEPDEIAALEERAAYYLEYQTFPYPRDDHRAYPWPLV